MKQWYLPAVFLGAALWGHGGGARADEVPASCPPFDHATNQPPQYPQAARDSHVGGTVILILDTDACGKVLGATVEKSSGRPDLDEAALLATKQWRLPNPADAAPKPSRIRLPIAFSPEETGQDENEDEVLRSMVNQWRNSQVPEIATAADGTLPGFLPDPLAMAPVGLSETLAMLERDGTSRQNGPGQGRLFMLAASYGMTRWDYLDEHTELGPALVRWRLVSDGKKAYWLASVLCEATARRCADLQEQLRGLPAQQALPPPPPPPQSLLERY